MRREAIGPLECTVLDCDQAPARLVVLCHGFGAPGDDLVPIGSRLRRDHPELAHRVRFVFPMAPLSLPGGWGGRAWWPLDAARIAERIARGEFEAVMAETPEGLGPARRQLLACLDALLLATGLGWGDLVLGGFSQGAMLSTDLALRADAAPRSLAVLSGALICASEWRRRAPRRRGLPVFQCHGLSDMVLPFPAGDALRALLEEAGLDVDFQRFGGGHGVPPAAVAALGELCCEGL